MNNPYLSVGAKVTLACMSVAILVMFGASLMQRLTNPSLIVPARESVGMSAEEAEANRVSAEIGMHMQEIKENPNDVAKLMHLADLLIQTQQWQSAETFVRRALDVDPKVTKGRYILGMILFNQEKYTDAALELEKVFELGEDSAARYSLGVLNIYYLDKISEGQAHLQKALEDPNLPVELKETIQEELQKK